VSDCEVLEVEETSPLFVFLQSFIFSLLFVVKDVGSSGLGIIKKGG